MKSTLYFDIDGTILDIDTGEAKRALADGAFEKLVRGERFGRLVCVGNFVDVIRIAGEYHDSYDGMGALFRVCGGAFSDETWFRDNISLVAESAHRAAGVDFTEDWWYVDDLAAYYFGRSGLSSEFSVNIGTRIFVPSPNGDGEDVATWLSDIQNKRVL